MVAVRFAPWHGTHRLLSLGVLASWAMTCPPIRVEGFFRLRFGIFQNFQPNLFQVSERHNSVGMGLGNRRSVRLHSFRKGEWRESPESWKRWNAHGFRQTDLTPPQKKQPFFLKIGVSTVYRVTTYWATDHKASQPSCSSRLCGKPCGSWRIQPKHQRGWTAIRGYFQSETPAVP